MQNNSTLRDILLTPEEWSLVSETTSILIIFNVYATKLQSTITTLSDFYGFWMILRIKLSKADNLFSQNLLQEMDKYQDWLMENPILLASLYLDPRYQRGLKDKKSLAIDFLLDLYARQMRIKNMNNSARSTTVVEEANDEIDSSSFEDLENYLQACQANVLFNEVQELSDRNVEVKTLLDQFWNVRAPLQTSVLDFWETNKINRPELYELACILNAIPPTQSTVERCFSMLALTLTSRRVRLGDDCLQNIMLVKLNCEVNVDE